jgi:polyphosphate kinase
MPRNLDNRIEVITPVDEPELAAEIDTALDLLLADTEGAWELDAAGAWTRLVPGEETTALSSQVALMERAVSYAEREEAADRREAAAERRLVRRAQPGKPGARTPEAG